MIAALPAWILVILFWRQDAIDPLTAPSLLLDRAFQVLTPALVPAGVFLLLGSKRAALWSVALTGVLGAMLGLAVVLAALIRPPVDLPATALAILVVLSSAWLVCTYAPRIARLRTVPAGVLAFALASLVPLLQLWSTVAWLPARTEATLTQEVSVDVAEVTDQAIRAVINYEAKNPTSSRALVIATRLTLCWWGANEEPFFDDARLRERVRAGDCRVVRPVSAESWVSPASNLRHSAAYAIPADRPRVTVIAMIAYARGDRLRTSGHVVNRAQLGACRDVRFVRLEEESRVKSLAQQDKYLVYGDRNSDGGLNFWFQSGSDFSSCSSGDSDQLEKYSGTTRAKQVRSMWLTDDANTKANPVMSPSFSPPG